MQSKHVLFVTILILESFFSHMAYSQDEEGWRIEIKTFENGLQLPVKVFDDPAKQESHELVALEANLQRYASEGYGEILDFIPVDKLQDLASVEILSSQFSEIRKIVEDYREPISIDLKLNDVLQRKIEAMKKLRKIILPGQLVAVSAAAKRRVRTRFYSTMIVSQNNFVDEEQRKQLVQECERINAELKAKLEQIQKLENECKNKYRAIFESVFSHDQKEIINFRAPVAGGFEQFVKSLSVQDLCADTDTELIKSRVRLP